MQKAEEVELGNRCRTSFLLFSLSNLFGEREFGWIWPQCVL